MLKCSTINYNLIIVGPIYWNFLLLNIFLFLYVLRASAIPSLIKQDAHAAFWTFLEVRHWFTCCSRGFYKPLFFYQPTNGNLGHLSILAKDSQFQHFSLSLSLHIWIYPPVVQGGWKTMENPMYRGCLQSIDVVPSHVGLNSHASIMADCSRAVIRDAWRWVYRSPKKASKCWNNVGKTISYPQNHHKWVV